jgi:serine/threonine protein kinase
LIGTEIGSCVLERLLGYGGSSAVFLARSLNSEEEQVAVKVFLPRSTLDGQMRKSFYQRFLREAEAASQLEHPNILSIYSYGEHNGLPYIVMPYMVGGTLAEYVQQHGPLSLQEALSYLEQVAAALDYLHIQGCVHCDVKPANILLNNAGGIALSDFGIIHLLDSENAPISLSQPAGKAANEVLMGTPDYISPEQALGENLDGRSDIYSLGATLYYFLTGAPPFESESPIALALMHVHEVPTPLGLLRADVTPQIDFVMAKALAKWPEERFQTAEAFCVALKLALKESGEMPQFSPKQFRKRLTGEQNRLLASAQPSVQIKPLAPIRLNTNAWRSRLLLGLIAVLLLGCVSTVLFIGANSTHSHATIKQSVATKTVAQQRDDLAGDEPDWPSSSTFFFTAGNYHIQNKLPGGLAMAFYADYQFTNFHLKVTTTEIAGSYNSADYYGVAFRASADQSHYYLFDVTDGYRAQYGFLRHDGGNTWTPLASGFISNFLTQPGQHNTIEIDTNGNAFTFFVNGKQVQKTFLDTSPQELPSGGIGLGVEEQNTEVAFSQLYISPLS